MRRGQIIVRTAFGALALGAAGCSRHVETTGSVPSTDYRERHPIVIANAPRRLDVFAMRGASGLDQRQADDVRAFAAEYRTSGQGPVHVGVQRGGPAIEATAAAVSRTLESAGVPARYLAIHTIPVDDPAAAPLVRLSFVKLQAKVDSLCGQWWTDFNGAATSATFRNQSPDNFGCAYQTSIAAQVANPIDLDHPRQETPVDVLKRSKDIDTLRQHKDPSTQWNTNSAQVGTTGG